MAGLLMAVSAQVTQATSAFWQITSVFTIVSPFPVLWLGLRDGFTSTLTACGIAVGFVLTATIFGAPYDLVAFLSQVIMILVLVRFSLLSRQTETNGVEWYPAGQILAYLIGICSLAVTIQVALGSGPIIPDEVLKDFATKFAASSAEQDQVFLTIKKVIYLVPGISALAMFMLFVANAKLAQNVLERGKQNIRPAGTYTYVTLPSYYLWAAAAAAGLTLSGIMGPFGPNILMVLIAGFFLVGLNLIHDYNRRYNLGTIMLVVFYVFMLVFGLLAAIVVSFIGLLEPWLRTHPKANGNLKG